MLYFQKAVRGSTRTSESGAAGRVEAKRRAYLHVLNVAPRGSRCARPAAESILRRERRDSPGRPVGPKGAGQVVGRGRSLCKRRVCERASASLGRRLRLTGTGSTRVSPNRIWASRAGDAPFLP